MTQKAHYENIKKCFQVSTLVYIKCLKIDCTYQCTIQAMKSNTLSVEFQD